MIEKIQNDLMENGYVKVNNVISREILAKVKKLMNEKLISFLKKKNKNPKSKLNDNFYECKKIVSQHEIQVFLAKHLIEKGVYTEILNQKKIKEILINLLGPDLEYVTNSELAINSKAESDEYYVKKYHQEFWSGAGIASLLFWVPFYLKPGMGTVEVIKKSHTWGHIPHSNREPIELPENYLSEKVNIKEGSLVFFTPLTLHRTVPNKLKEIRVAAPITVRNFYYPKIGNEDLWEFKKLNFSFFSHFRKILGNPQFSAFRTFNQKRKSIFLKEKIKKKY